jgi:phosphatidylcholine synthase
MPHSILRALLAWGVHAFTASGALWGLLSILAIQRQDWRAAFIWMAVAVVVDGADGGLARLAQVKTYAPQLDGALMDNLLDYLNYVVVPALFILEARLVPPALAIPAAAIVLLTSAYQFSQADAKTEDHFFRGFPCYWNVAVVYLFILAWPPGWNFAALAALGILVFVPFKYLYPSRTAPLRRLSLALTWVWAAVTLFGLFQYPAVPAWVVPLTAAYALYYLTASWYAARHARPTRHLP